jgi:hypothetical protein
MVVNLCGRTSPPSTHRHSSSEGFYMASKNTAVFGIYRTPEDAERSVDALMGAGFASSAISVLLPDNESTRAFAHHKDTKAPEGTTAGVTTGGVIGGALGVLAGIGALAIPGVGPLIAAGPIVAGLAGLGVGGAVGGLVGALIGMGIPEYEAKRYEGRVKDGGTLLSVHCDTSDQVSRAKDLLKSSGAQDISSTSEAAGAKLDDRGEVDARYASEPRVAGEPRVASFTPDTTAAGLPDPAYTTESVAVREVRAGRIAGQPPVDPIDPAAPRIHR